MAQRGHLPDRRWPWRLRLGHAALRATQQLAGQRQPRQGTPSALADHAEIRPQDLLGGCAAVEAAAKAAGHAIPVPFSPGRTDASQEQTDVHAFAVLEPVADGFRNYLCKGYEASAAALLVDRANLLTLTGPEMTVTIRSRSSCGACVRLSTGTPSIRVMVNTLGVVSASWTAGMA